MSRILRYLPELKGDEQIHVARLMKPMTDDEAEQFAHVYRQRRKDPTMTLLAGLIGFGFVAGVQRFYLDQVVMGLLYLLTAGFCFVGTVIDIVGYKRLTFQHNREQADDVATLVRSRS